MFSNLMFTDDDDTAKPVPALNNPESYLKNLAEYQRMLELISQQEYLITLLGKEDTLLN